MNPFTNCKGIFFKFDSMKHLILFITFLASTLLSYAQKSNEKEFIKIQYKTPKNIYQGTSIKLQATIIYKTLKEQTGNITLSLLNHQSKKSIDGWCINIFPFQYFTTIPGKHFNTEFPFTIPFDYEGKIDVVLKAEAGTLNDSIFFTLPILKK